MASGTAYGVADSVANADTRPRNERFRPSMRLTRIDLFGDDGSTGGRVEITTIRHDIRRAAPSPMTVAAQTKKVAAQVTGGLSHRSGTSCSGCRRSNRRSPSSIHCPPESRKSLRELFRGGTIGHDVARSIAMP